MAEHQDLAEASDAHDSVLDRYPMRDADDQLGAEFVALVLKSLSRKRLQVAALWFGLKS